MGLIRRCSVCRKENVRYSVQGLECNHKEAIWAVKFLVGDKQIFKTLGRNKRDAERYLMQTKSNLASGGSYEKIKPMLFKELAEKWMTKYRQSGNPKPGTIWAYDTRLKLHILPLMGRKIVNQINTYDIEIVKQVLREKLSARSTNATITQIGTIMKYGWRLGFCKSNPAQLVEKIPTGEGVSKTISTEQASTLLSHSYEQYRTIFFSMLCTGARVGEITALQWGDVDFKNSFITIQRNVFRGPIGRYGMKDKTWLFGTPKSKDSKREVSLFPALKAALLIHAERSGRNALNLVFCTKSGRPYDRSTLREKLNAFTKAASLTHIRLHDLRHTNATWLLARGAHLAAVSKHLGHSGVAITGDIYHHVTSADHQKNIKIMTDIFPVWDAKALPEPPKVDGSH